MRGQLIIRLDDVRDLSPRLEAVWRVLERHGMPVHLGAIPADVDDGTAQRLRERAARSTSRVSVQQHGHRHVNHGTDRKRFEFGETRSEAQQREDLSAGRDALQRYFGERFDGVFVPPWDRCDATTMAILANLGYAGISVIETSSAPVHAAVPRVVMTTDPVNWRPTPTHRDWDRTLGEVRGRLEQHGYAGIELHHEIMDDDAVRGLDGLLARLPGVAKPTMLEVARGLRGAG
jgi:peptidoglycan/xylan/chitin deacetylase (PgdA/CDA1 family)